MDARIKALWLADLRSGETTQTRHALVRTQPNDGEPAGACCLGVLTLIAEREGIVERQEIDDATAHFRPTDYTPTNRYNDAYEGWTGGCLPDGVSEWAGLDPSTNLPTVSVDAVYEATGRTISSSSGTTALSTLNDAYGMDFNQIADIIEKGL